MLALLVSNLLPISYLSAKEPTVLRFVTEDLPPHQITKNNELVGGRSYLILKEAIEKTQYSAQFDVLPWARAYTIAQNEENVIIFSIVRSPERENEFKWVSKLKDLEYNFYYANSNQSIKIDSIEDALKYKVVTTRGGIEEDILVERGFVIGENLILTRGYIEAWEMVSKGRADLTLASQLLSKDRPENNPLNMSPYTKHPLKISAMSLYVAANKKTSDLIVSDLQRMIASVIEQEKFKNFAEN